MVDWNGGDRRCNTSLTETNEDEGGTIRDNVGRQSADDKVHSLVHSTKGRKEEIGLKDRTNSSTGSTSATMISQGCTRVHHAQQRLDKMHVICSRAEETWPTIFNASNRGGSVSPLRFLKVLRLGKSWYSTRKTTIYQDYTRTLPGIPLEAKQPGMNCLVNNGCGRHNQDSWRTPPGICGGV